MLSLDMIKREVITLAISTKNIRYKKITKIYSNPPNASRELINHMNQNETFKTIRRTNQNQAQTMRTKT